MYVKMSLVNAPHHIKDLSHDLHELEQVDIGSQL